MKKPPDVDQPRSIRYPNSLWNKIAKMAKKEGRTIAREIIFRLQKSLENN